MNIKKNIWIVILSVLIVTSCKKWVEVDTPNFELVSGSVFTNSSTATSSLFGIYINMYSQQESYSMSLQTGLLGDELTSYGSSENTTYYNDNLVAGSSFTFQNIPGPWINAYKYIYSANAIIDGLKKTGGIAPSVKNQLTGESKFIRAFWLYYLTNSYGAVPVPTTTDYTVNSMLARSAPSLVFDQIISDLKDAQGLLNSGYVDASDTTVYDIAVAERVRPTKSAAAALLARAYLFKGDYANAAIQASAVIANTSMYNLEADLNNVFLKNSREAIWQLSIPLPTNGNTREGFWYILLGSPASGNVTVSPQLLSSFEPSDNRKANWIGSVTTTSPMNTFYFPYKYKVHTGSAVSEYQMVLRLAEQYLIRAEAEANGAGDGLNGAVRDLNAIRNRAGLPNYSGTIDKASLITAILHERQVELFTEWGDRWFSLRRTGSIDSVMGVVTPLKGGTWDAHKALLPIPLDDISTDRNLTQNPGY